MQVNELRFYALSERDFRLIKTGLDHLLYDEF